MSYHCSTHGIKHSSVDCPRCVAEKRHEELVEAHEEAIRLAGERHEEAIAAARASEYTHANPGDYECPECLYITLKRRASRCPRCHATVGNNYWLPVIERERNEAEERKRREQLAAEEWARGEPERQRRAKAAAEAETRVELAGKKANFWFNLATVYFFYLLPSLVIGTTMVTVAVTDLDRWRTHAPESSMEYVLVFVPVLNWMAILGVFVTGAADSQMVILGLIIWGFVGFCILMRGLVLGEAAQRTSGSREV